MSFSKRLKELRKEKNLTQIELAAILKFGRTTISAYEVGRNEPDYDVLQKLAEYFNVSVDYLLGRTNNKNIIIKEHNNVKFHITKNHEEEYTAEDLELALKIIKLLKQENKD